MEKNCTLDHKINVIKHVKYVTFATSCWQKSIENPQVNTGKENSCDKRVYFVQFLRKNCIIIIFKLILLFQCKTAWS